MSTVSNSPPGIARDVSDWLRKKVRGQALLLVCAGVAFCAIGAILVYLSYLATRFGLTWFRYEVNVKGEPIKWTVPQIQLASGLITALLFFGYHLVAEKFSEDFEIELSGNRRVTVTVAQYTDYGWTRMFEGWHFLLFFLRVLSAVLFLGPQTVAAGIRQFQRAKRLLSLDTAGCGQLIGFIASWREKVPFKVLTKKLPELELPALLSQISYLDGVVYRKSDPPGVSLAPHLRDEIEEWAKTSGPRLSVRGASSDEDAGDE